MAHPTFADELELHRVNCASSHRMVENYDFEPPRLRRNRRFLRQIRKRTPKVLRLRRASPATRRRARPRPPAANTSGINICAHR
jgi:hypothetical protein